MPSERPFTQAQLAASKLTVKSALNPALWAAGTVCPVCFTAAWFFRSYPEILRLLIWAGFVPIGLVSIGYIYFMLADPDKLQSEEYQLRKMGIIRGKHLGEIDDEHAPLLPAPSD